MSITKRILIGFILVFAFTLLFNQIFNLTLRLIFIFPDGAFDYPRPKTVNNEYVLFLKILLAGIIPIGLSMFFILKTKILARLTKNWGLTLLAITVSIYLVRYGLLYASTFIRGGGLTFALSHLLSHFNIPLKVVLVTGLLKVILSLTQGSNTSPSFKSEKIGLFLLTLGLGAVLSTTINLSLANVLMILLHISSNKLFLSFFLNTVIYLVIAFTIIYKTKLHKKIVNNYNIYLLGICASIYYVNSFLVVKYILKYITEHTADYIHYYSVFNLLVIFTLIIAFIKICLTLKPLRIEQ